MKKYLQILSIISFFTLLFYLPILLDYKILVNRGNDLTDFFWPLIFFAKNSLIKYHQLPLWNNLFFSGTPLLPDPQAPIFYLPNIIFLFTKNIDIGFVISSTMHIFLGGIGFFLLSQKGFRFSQKTSLFLAIIYIIQPKLSGFIEAGHFGLIASWTWLPFAFLATILLANKQTFKNVIFLSISLALIFYTHILIFIITVCATSILFVYLTLVNKSNLLKNFIFLTLSGIFCFGLIAIAFLPQLSWQSETTRNLLLDNPDVYPKWLTKTEFLKSSISPILFGPRFIWNLDAEKIIGIGLFTSIFIFSGFLQLKTKHKFLILITTSLITLISLNNISPIYSLLIKQNWYILLRVATRLWFLIIIISIFLTGVGLETLVKNKKTKFLIYSFCFLTIIELLITSWARILKPISSNLNLAPREVYEFLSQDKSRFRVFCLERCLSQKESAIYGLELADGYGTLQQKNYYEYSQQLSQAYFRNRYTLSIPPLEIFSYESLQPYSPNLSAFNIKYVISNHTLKDKNLKLVRQIDKFLIYENLINKPRSNYPITIYTPNFIQIDTSSFKTNKIILSEVYNKDWQAYLNGTQKLEIKQSPDKIREIEIDRNTKFVNLYYYPSTFKIGSLITVSTLAILFISSIIF